MGFRSLSSSKRSTKGIVLIIRLSWSSRGGVQTPSGLQRFRHLPGLAELQVTGLLGNNGALMFGCQLRYESCNKSAGFLRVEVTLFLRNINNRSNDFLMALFWPLLKGTTSSADLDRKLLTGGVSHELAGLLLHVLGLAGGLVHSPAFLGSLAVTNLLYRFVTFVYSLVESFLFEGDGT